MKYTVTGQLVQFGIGQVLKLTKDQIDARLYGLKIDDENKGLVTATQILSFKKGEEIDLKDKAEELPRSLVALLTPTSKLPKAEKPAGKKEPAGSDADDLDAIEKRLEAAEAAYNTALGKLKIPVGVELTAEQRALVEIEAAELDAAQTAYDAAVGED